MSNYELKPSLKKVLRKLFKKDKETHKQIFTKIEEILNCGNIDHYKNLRKPLQDFKRVHIKSSFVLIFKYIKPEDKVVFFDLGHHDRIYN